MRHDPQHCSLHPVFQKSGDLQHRLYAALHLHSYQGARGHAVRRLLSRLCTHAQQNSRAHADIPGCNLTIACSTATHSHMHTRHARARTHPHSNVLMLSLSRLRIHRRTDGNLTYTHMHARTNATRMLSGADGNLMRSTKKCFSIMVLPARISWVETMPCPGPKLDAAGSS